MGSKEWGQRSTIHLSRGFELKASLRRSKSAWRERMGASLHYSESLHVEKGTGDFVRKSSLFPFPILVNENTSFS